MVQWWKSINALLVESKVTKEQVKRAVDSSKIAFRSGFHSVMKLLRDHQVPTLVFSAGLCDVIHLALEREAVASDNVQVVSNAMNFGAEGVIEGFCGDIIHPLNKTARVLIDFSA
ncbi:Cytosolic 5'-nucleotidase 3 [Phytophthora citrophthora]|uniref:5'-nucleotidase n=1 Tax=Phytophthora citrophthora TaxID=4793 RepID=A0AAD9GI45_9STRA|nr:Cytosolic 5'-nucleotidase 3 [Phytophthora citrophthora]